MLILVQRLLITHDLILTPPQYSYIINSNGLCIGKLFVYGSPFVQNA